MEWKTKDGDHPSDQGNSIIPFDIEITHDLHRKPVSQLMLLCSYRSYVLIEECESRLGEVTLEEKPGVEAGEKVEQFACL